MSENVLLFIARSSLPGGDWNTWLEYHKIVGGYEIHAGSTEILYDGLNGLIVLAKNALRTDSVPSKPAHPTPPPVHYQILDDGMSYLVPLTNFQIPKLPSGFGSVGAGDNINAGSLLADEGE